MKAPLFNYSIIINLLLTLVFFLVFIHFFDKSNTLGRDLISFKKNNFSRDLYIFKTTALASIRLDTKYCPDSDPKSYLLFKGNNQFVAFPLRQASIELPIPGDFGTFHAELSFIKIYSRAYDYSVMLDHLKFDPYFRITDFRLASFGKKSVYFSLSNCYDYRVEKVIERD